MEAINLQGVLARYLDRDQRLSPRQWQVCSHIQACRTAALGELGMMAALHTWGQNLSQHVHLHCLIPGGAFQQRQTIVQILWKDTRARSVTRA